MDNVELHPNIMELLLTETLIFYFHTILCHWWHFSAEMPLGSQLILHLQLFTCGGDRGKLSGTFTEVKACRVVDLG